MNFTKILKRKYDKSLAPFTSDCETLYDLYVGKPSLNKRIIDDGIMCAVCEIIDEFESEDIKVSFTHSFYKGSSFTFSVTLFFRTDRGDVIWFVITKSRYNFDYIRVWKEGKLRGCLQNVYALSTKNILAKLFAVFLKLWTFCGLVTKN